MKATKGKGAAKRETLKPVDDKLVSSMFSFDLTFLQAYFGDPFLLLDECLCLWVSSLLLAKKFWFELLWSTGV